jgi:hypothetical protein
MEPLWNPVVATGGNRGQIGPAPKRLKQAKIVAVGCDRLPSAAHGKEGVDGSSPSEGLAGSRMATGVAGAVVTKGRVGSSPMETVSEPGQSRASMTDGRPSVRAPAQDALILLPSICGALLSRSDSVADERAAATSSPEASRSPAAGYSG